MIETVLTILYVTFALLLVWFSFRSYRGGVAYLQYFRSNLETVPPTDLPSATIIAPCKGYEPGLLGNLLSLVNQTHGNYNVVFVVDDPDDTAVPTINELIESSEVRTQLVIAEKAKHCAQKLGNLIAGVAASGGSDILVFVDSDARPDENWLASLIDPLVDDRIGATTGYRWFVSPLGNFASEMRAAWNASIASALGPDTSSNFCWGGSMAIRREVFDRLQIAESWSRGLSDDFLVTRAMKAAGLPIVFVPQALTPSIGDCSSSELIEFTDRQMKITRVYATKLWAMSFVGSGLFITVMLSSLAIALFCSRCVALRIFAIVVIIAVIGFSSVKAKLRLDAVKLAISEHHAAIDRQAKWQYTLWLITPALFFYNCVSALFSRKITWRGIEYEMLSPNETKLTATGRGDEIENV